MRAARSLRLVLTGITLAGLLLGGGSSSVAQPSVVGSADPPAAPVEATAADPESPTVSARLETREARIGDTVKLTVTTVGPLRVPVNLPANLDLAPFEILDREERESPLGDGKIRREFVFHIAAFETGELTVPSLPLTYLGKAGAVRTARTEPLPLTIKSVLANEPDPALKANAAPVPVLQEVRWPLYLGGAVIAALLGALLGSYLVARLRRRQRVVPVPPPRPAHEVALERLDRLGAQLSGEDLRPFYFQLSEVLREYFGARFGFDSLELTTDELIEELQRRSPEALPLAEVQGWLLSCDLVKFARVSPREDEARAALDAGLSFVTRTVPAPSAPVEPASQEAAGA